MIASTAIIPAGAGADAVSTITGQLTADLPELLVILAAIAGISLVIRLLRKYLSGEQIFHTGMSFREYKDSNPDRWDYEYWAKRSGKDF